MMVALHLLEHAVGILDWVTSAIPGARPWLAICFGRQSFGSVILRSNPPEFEKGWCL